MGFEPFCIFCIYTWASVLGPMPGNSLARERSNAVMLIKFLEILDKVILSDVEEQFCYCKFVIYGCYLMDIVG